MKKYWVTKTNAMQLNSNGDFAEIKVTSVSFESSAQAADYVREKNDEHHEYMLQTHDRTELGTQYGYLTDDGILEGRLRGINIKDKR